MGIDRGGVGGTSTRRRRAGAGRGIGETKSTRYIVKTREMTRSGMRERNGTSDDASVRPRRAVTATLETRRRETRARRQSRRDARRERETEDVVRNGVTGEP